MPRYSIVVPTLNRAHLLDATLQSLTKIDHGDYEVIISNNSSQDSTEVIAKKWVETDSRVRYVKTDKKLCMSDHWDFALKFVEGDYFLYVGDDDSFDLNILRILDHYFEDDAIEGISWAAADYFYPSWFQEKYAGKLYIPSLSGTKKVILAEQAIEHMFNLSFPKVFPVGTTFCFKTSIARLIVDRCHTFFARPYPDYTSTMMYLPRIKRYLFIDMALSVMGKSLDSNSAALRKNGPTQRGQEFLLEHDGLVYPNVPLQYNLIFNGMAESVRIAQLLHPEDLGIHKFNWVFYFHAMYGQLRTQGEYVDSGNGKHKFWLGLLQMPLDVQLKVMYEVSKIEAYRFLQGAHRRFGDGRNGLGVQSIDTYADYFCKELSSIVDCAHELARYNAEIGYF